MPKIFISYRRNDSAGHAGRLHDRLVGHFGEGLVFMDVDTIKPGLNFVEVVQEAVGSCDALIAVIGREWLTASDPAGTGGRRLDDPADMVRLEIATAIERDVQVIPVLVQGAQMPRSLDLPENLKGLAYRNALEVSDAGFSSEVGRLIEVLEAPPSQRLADSVFVEPAQPSGERFVGRDREMAGLKVSLEQALSGQGRLVMLVGEPGIGKTRVAQELAAQADMLGAQVLWGWCYEEEGAPPYWPWIQPIRSYIQKTDPAQLASEMGAGAADIAEIVPDLREKLPDLESPPSLDPEQARFRLFQSITTFLMKSAQFQPLMLVLDDLHWGDRSSLLLLQFLAREMGGSRLLVVGTYRDVELSRQHPLSETLAQLTRQPVFRRELLRGLSQEDTEQFIASVASVEPSQQLTETIYDRTEGNPFFMTEVVRLLSDQGDLASGEIGGSTGLIIPEGVKEVIGQRLDRLSGRCNEVLTTASIIGKEFHFKLLGVLIDDISEEVLGQAIDEAVNAHMVEEVYGSWETYRFSHALVQETLSVEVPTRTKVRLHARIGPALESLFGTDVQTHADELAFHFGEAEPILGPEKFLHYSLLSGEQALAGYAFEEALGHFRRALTVKKEQPMDEETALLLLGQGRAQAALLQIGDARNSLTRAFDYYVEAGNITEAVKLAVFPVGFANTGIPELVTRAMELVVPDSHDAGRLLSQHGFNRGEDSDDYDGAQEDLGRALSIAEREGDVSLQMWTLARSGHIGMTYLRSEECVDKNGKVVELNIQADEPNAEGFARACLVQTLVTRGSPEEAWLQSQAMLTLAERTRNRSFLVLALSLNVNSPLFKGDWKSARELSDRGLPMAPHYWRLLYTRVLLEYEVGEFAQGDAYMETLLGVIPSHRSDESQMAIGFPAITIALVGRITGSDKWLDIAEEAARTLLSSSPTPRPAMAARMALALIAAQRGDQVEADEQYNIIEPLRVSYPEDRHICISVDRLLANLSVTLNRLDQAITHFEEALAFCRKAGYRPELAWTCCDYADTLLQRNESGDREKAMSLMDESLAISTELGMRPLMERVISRQDCL